ncbi:M20/M25/M40 family metallo-hydrolase [Novosphingobium piscinae]|uniref:M20/M25/M40 family metallo-hydrolase n=1 Tax=Novosphingobium piscinae TaxID=1507448 RepID=A0A7X1FVM7_9SPHN|nr:M20/M25/M40 family metallo-hydrolase [Novosphingobium piscinae]MBC2667834.1 M20/M25/M40 family metallo-hydrolase [Novosphingobium piscinae]
MKFAFTAIALLLSAPAAAADLRPDQVAFRQIYKELVETNTTYSSGSCTAAAEKVAARLRAAGYAESEIRLFEPPGHPREGGLVATLVGSDPRLKPMLLLAHIDVVEAKRADWTRDPFTLIEEDGYFYGRGTVDDKPHAAIWTDTLIRLKARKPPARTIRMALTCGEEGGGTIVGAEWLAKEHKDWIDAEFALNEGSSGAVDAAGKPISLAMQAGEKVFQDFRIEATNPGGHSSLPRPDNALYDLAAALLRIGAYEFPVQFTDATRGYFAARAKIDGGEMGAAMTRLLADPRDDAANAIVSRNPSLHSMLRTTCVATLANAGHANNALPQRATANVNCRMFPGDPIDNVRAQLVKAIGNPAVTVTPVEPISPTPPPPPLTDAIYRPALALAKTYYPGVPVLPTLLPGATDGRFLNAVGIPTYGVPGAMLGPTGDGMHGLNERKSVAALYTERDYLFDLVKVYAGVK